MATREGVGIYSDNTEAAEWTFPLKLSEKRYSRSETEDQRKCQLDLCIIGTALRFLLDL